MFNQKQEDRGGEEESTWKIIKGRNSSGWETLKETLHIGAGEGAILGPGSLRDKSAQVRVRTTEVTQFLGQAEATQLLGQTRFRLQISEHLPCQRRGVWAGGL